jgi:hypothetical protein
MGSVMAIYAIRRRGRTPDMRGFTLVALERPGEERPIITFESEKEARETMASLNKSNVKSDRYLPLSE